MGGGELGFVVKGLGGVEGSDAKGSAAATQGGRGGGGAVGTERVVHRTETVRL